MAFMLNFNKTCRHGTTMTTKRGSLQTLTHLLSLKIMLRMWNDDDDEERIPPDPDSFIIAENNATDVEYSFAGRFLFAIRVPSGPLV
ncbi:hypothetical protein QE152_g35642 [Popillia japonica]|uniref:Uncharacterized protein n=1 Tax=Popillia japonica TaxID=7064 RepID=A0AAW1IFJ3_POPJA